MSGLVTKLYRLKINAGHGALKACCKGRTSCGGSPKSPTTEAWKKAKRDIKRLPPQKCD
jgi:hypothetical protein